MTGPAIVQNPQITRKFQRQRGHKKVERHADVKNTPRAASRLSATSQQSKLHEDQNSKTEARK